VEADFDFVTKVISDCSDEGGGCKKAHPEEPESLAERKTHRQAKRDSMHQEGVPFMALGVLNNLSAIYAENNLNKTSTSLQTVLQQLSSGSKINSGADDAAGLSLVNGLQANSEALTQSATNATEGVGLLDVADGALSQVTSLLDRAITLATEASNGTMNSSQEQAANQEYTSILSEINNIGSTTTYNQERVFAGNTVAIYTGDSSTAGSSIDNLYIRTLSESSVGDTGGTMSYSMGQNNVFLNLSSSTVNASASDSLGLPTATTSISVNYLTKGAGGAATAATATISVGAGTNYANTAQGLISAINDSGLGLTATFTTAKEAGSSAVSSALGTGTETGILITGQNVGAGTAPGEVGTLTETGTAASTLGGTLTIGSANIALGTANSTDTLANLETTINAGNYGVTASISGSTLTLTSTNSTINISSTDLTDAGGTLTLGNVPASLSGMSTSAGTIGTLTLTGDTTSGDTLSGALKIVGANGITKTVTVSAANGNNTIATLATYINNLNIGVTATPSSAGTTATLTFASTTADSKANVTVSTPFVDTQAGNVTAAFNYAGSTAPTAYYSLGISGSVTDNTTSGGTLVTAMTTDTDGATGVATTSYSDDAGQSLTGTDLLTQSDAETALTDLNKAITDVAAMDGYIGAQINTLNSVSSVLTTQQENVTSAQNAIQATDYASATSAMSKYEILSQTGIAALAQANSVQQEVTKLLQ
jgi:flagellin